MVQEAYLRAFKFFDRYRGGDASAWLLTVVRNSCYTWLKQNRARDLLPFDEAAHSAFDAPGPDAPLLQKGTVELVREAGEELPAVFRESWSCATWRGSRTRTSPPSPTCPWAR